MSTGSNSSDLFDVRWELGAYIDKLEKSITNQGSKIKRVDLLGHLIELITKQLMLRERTSDNPVASLKQIIGSPQNLTESIIEKHFISINRAEELADEGLSRQLSNKEKRLIYPYLTRKNSLTISKAILGVNYLLFTMFIFFGFQSFVVLSVIGLNYQDWYYSSSLLQGGISFLFFKWHPRTLIIMGGTCLILSLVSNWGLKQEPIMKALGNDFYYQYRNVLKMNRVNLVSYILFSIFLILGSILERDFVRINGFEPITDLLVPLIVGTTMIFSSYVYLHKSSLYHGFADINGTKTMSVYQSSIFAQIYFNIILILSILVTTFSFLFGLGSIIGIMYFEGSQLIQSTYYLTLFNVILLVLILGGLSMSNGHTNLWKKHFLRLFTLQTIVHSAMIIYLFTVEQSNQLTLQLYLTLQYFILMGLIQFSLRKSIKNDFNY
ncbi:MAG: hypothetical protein ACXAD7_02360 [Candidatus Kariarchaeaceae archaeon]